VRSFVAIAAAVLATAPAAQAAGGKALRVDRPEKGAGARVTTVHIVSGAVTHRMRAVVLTDTRCNPDAQGVSHCLTRSVTASTGAGWRSTSRMSRSSRAASAGRRSLPTKRTAR